MTGWLAGAPALRGNFDWPLAALEALLALLEPYSVITAESSEPRSYRLTSRGRAALRERIIAGRIESVSVMSPNASVAGVAGAIGTLTLGSWDNPDMAMRLDLCIEPPTNISRQDLALQLASFVARWFERLGAAAAFVSGFAHQDGQFVGDAADRTNHEIEWRVSTLMSWSAVRRFARGAFWATGLGPDLCALLGGQRRVLAEAPAAIARPLGAGVWLQLSDQPPPDAADLAALAAYLGPLLSWTQADLLAVQAAARAEDAVASTATDRLPQSPLPGPRSRRSRRRLRVEILDDMDDPSVGLNVYLASPLTPGRIERVSVTVVGWYEQGFAGAFGGAGFHFLSDAAVDETASALRWTADLGSADPARAFEALRQALSDLPDLDVERIVIGTETVG